ncbi:hypothetical protein BaRGS_00013023 [Batillaria attramentaria]|uniref:Queuine tRNA-ribosyltransferase accessory subunit 2 n=1 Tax=Batillaria attramentaria TaxID=370345 RepID=A0ABD0L8U7_9CAEN
MKFSVEKIVHGGCRLGLLHEVGKLQSVTVETPLCLLHTKAGSAPNLSMDTLGYIQNLPPIALMPLNLLAEHHETLEEYKKGIADFTAMKDFLICCSLQDPCTAVPSGYNDKTSVALWGRAGKMKVDPELFVKIQEAFQPDWFQCLGDSDTNKDSSKKRSKKAVDNTLNFLDEILKRRKSSEILQQSSVFGSIEGGFNQFERERSAKETAARGVDGFAIEGFQSDGQEFRQFHEKEFTDILGLTLKHLPEDKPRMMLGVWRPDSVLQAVSAGIDIFDSSYAYSVSEKGRALVFDFDYHKKHWESITDDDGSENSKNATTTGRGFSVDLKDSRYKDDFSPVLKGCGCYTCKTYTRAYLNHLLTTSELQSGVLLMVHNLHHYFGFFEAIRQSLREDKFQQLQQLIDGHSRSPSADR